MLEFTSDLDTFNENSAPALRAHAVTAILSLVCPYTDIITAHFLTLNAKL